MKNILLYGVALLAASAAQAQSNTTTLTFNTPQTMNASGCQVTGVTTLTINTATASITTDGAQNCSCTGTSCTTQPQAAVVTVSPASLSYTLGSGAAPPTITYSSSVQGVTCSLPNAGSNGFTYVSGANSFILSSPTNVGTYNFTVSCTPPAGYTVSVVPASVSLTVSSRVTSGFDPNACTPNPSSVLGGKTLTRQCTGLASYSGNKFAQKAYSGNMFRLQDVLGGGTWSNYITGYSFTPTITTGQYIALSFVPTASGSIQFTNDPSFGDGGLISLSTVPGAFLPTDTGVICAYGRGASNSLYINTTPGGYCSVASGQVYYVNFAATDFSGTPLCYGTYGSTTCASSVLSYSEIVGK